MSNSSEQFPNQTAFSGELGNSLLEERAENAVAKSAALQDEQDRLGAANLDSYAKAVDAAKRTYERANATLRAATQEGQEVLAAEAQQRPLTVLLATLAIGFLVGRAF
jgi:hypothetical protein